MVPLVSALRQASTRACLTGLHGSTAAFALTSLVGAPALAALRTRPWVVVTGSNEAAERMFADLRFCHQMVGAAVDRITLFPQWETLPYESTAPHVGLIAHRMQTLHRLRTTPGTMLVTSVAPSTLPRSVAGPIEIQKYGFSWMWYSVLSKPGTVTSKTRT